MQSNRSAAPHVDRALSQSLADPKERTVKLFRRVVVIVVFTAIVAVALSALFVALRFGGPKFPRSAHPWRLGRFTLFVSSVRPTLGLILASVLGVAVIAIFALSCDLIVSLMVLSPRFAFLERIRSKGRYSGQFPKATNVIVLIPAHNEESTLPISLKALFAQTRPPDRVIVIADNCTDGTVGVAEAMGCDLFTTKGNELKKAGALNQALSSYLPKSHPADVILVMDADTQLSSQFLEVATNYLCSDSRLAAVGGVFYGERGSGLVGQFQRNEYIRYANQIAARRGRVFVLTGTASIFRAQVLLDVAAARGVLIPGAPGKVYDTAALTEDNELTLALKSLGAKMNSPKECRVLTEVMPTWKALWRQRQRWLRGALENLGSYGLTRGTIRYWGQQFGIGYGSVALISYLSLMFITVGAMDHPVLFPFWIAVGFCFVAERVVTAIGTDWKGLFLAALILPELLYDMFQEIVFIYSLFGIATGRQARWSSAQEEVRTT
jgi:poly-beta-1,6-N-acetyl-D-glucosamine synthase